MMQGMEIDHGDRPANMKSDRTTKTSLERIPSKDAGKDESELCSPSYCSWAASDTKNASFRAAKSFQRMVNEMGSNTKFFEAETTALLNDLDSIRSQNRRTERRIKHLRCVSNDMRGQLMLLTQKTRSGSQLHLSVNGCNGYGRSADNLGRW